MTANTRAIEDSLERYIEVPAHPARIVSLVPSVTELLFDIGAGSRVVGVSSYCTEPAAALVGVARVGGQKNPDLDAICALSPDVVIAVKEENHKRDVRKLAERGVAVYVAQVKTVEAAVAFVGEIGDLVDGDAARIEAITSAMKASISSAQKVAATHAPVPLFCPVWRDPWITISPDTYMYDFLRLAGGAPLSLGRPLDQSGQRYPKTTLDAVRDARPSLILLPDEPYAFSASDAAEFSPLAPAWLVDGKLLSWYGKRATGIHSLAMRVANLAAESMVENQAIPVAELTRQR